MSDATQDPTRCALCGGPNECGMARGASECWCFSATIPSEVLAAVSDGAKGVVCVCAACAAKGTKRTLTVAGS